MYAIRSYYDLLELGQQLLLPFREFLGHIDHDTHHEVPPAMGIDDRYPLAPKGEFPGGRRPGGDGELLFPPKRGHLDLAAESRLRDVV